MHYFCFLTIGVGFLLFRKHNLRAYLLFQASAFFCISTVQVKKVMSAVSTTTFSRVPPAIYSHTHWKSKGFYKVHVVYLTWLRTSLGKYLCTVVLEQQFWKRRPQRPLSPFFLAFQGKNLFKYVNQNNTTKQKVQKQVRVQLSSIKPHKHICLKKKKRIVVLDFLENIFSKCIYVNL